VLWRWKRRFRVEGEDQTSWLFDTVFDLTEMGGRPGTVPEFSLFRIGFGVSGDDDDDDSDV
jgi:hypothetical protein